MDKGQDIILYHYCSNDAFLSIIQNKSIWLSDLSLSNDSLEGRLIWNRIEEKCNERNLPAHEIKQFKEYLSEYYQCRGHVGFSLSEEGDLLSQWRAYADGGHGVSIGFSRYSLERIFCSKDGAYSIDGHSLLKVQYQNIRDSYLGVGSENYGNEEHMDGIIDNIRDGLIYTYSPDRIPEHEWDKYSTAAHDLMMACGMLDRVHYRYKSSTFQEEKEWRIVKYYSSNIKYRSNKDRIVPYEEVILDEENFPIEEVILGPRNITPESVVWQFLKENSPKNVKVRKSESTLRQ